MTRYMRDFSKMLKRRLLDARLCSTRLGLVLPESGYWGSDLTAKPALFIICCDSLRNCLLLLGTSSTLTKSSYFCPLPGFLATRVRSLRNESSASIGFIAGIAYTYMVAAWGGYIFVLNMIAVHAMTLSGMGRHSTKLWKSYSLFYIVGTLGALQVPVVGWAPLKSLEQLGAFAVFCGLQLMEYTADHRRKNVLMTNFEFLQYRIKIFSMVGAVAVAIIAVLLPTGYFGPLSARIRGLFLKHTRTGNPLVDSVAEHQPASAEAYWQYLQNVMYAAPAGLVISLFSFRTDGKYFLAAYALIAYHFSRKMSRLIIILGPISSSLAGIALAFVCSVASDQYSNPAVFFLGLGLTAFVQSVYLRPFLKSFPVLKTAYVTSRKAFAAVFGSFEPYATPAFGLLAMMLLDHLLGKAFSNEAIVDQEKDNDDTPEVEAEKTDETKDSNNKGKSKGKGKGKINSKTTGGASEKKDPVKPTILEKLSQFKGKAEKKALKVYRHPSIRFVLQIAGVLAIGKSMVLGKEFTEYCQRMAEAMSGPSIMYKANLQNGEQIIVDDYREGYWWLRDNTPEDARVMAWWDYGYQITGIGNRTTIADGNTWNHEHIATLGRTLSAPEKDAHRIARHLADYVLIWTGGGGDDLAKSPHMARIGNSVYNDICPGDPTCRQFGFIDQQGTPTPMMAKSLLYKLHSGGPCTCGLGRGTNWQCCNKPGEWQQAQTQSIKVDTDRFEHVFTSKYGKMRIWKILKVSEKSKKWVINKRKNNCDAGGWYCPGDYPPALDWLMAKKKSFAQVEDWNREKSEADKKYQEEYMRKMAGH